MTPLLKYRFKILYQTRNAKDVSNFMEKCDLRVGELCFEETIEFGYTAEEKPVAYFKDLIRQAMESTDHILLQIKGGKVE